MQKVLIFLLFSNFVFGSLLKVQSKKSSYLLKIEDDVISFESFKSQISVKKLKCNQDSFEIFKTKLDQKLKKKVISSKPDSIVLTIDEKVLNLDPNSALAHYLQRMQQSISALKITEGIDCEKN